MKKSIIALSLLYVISFNAASFEFDDVESTIAVGVNAYGGVSGSVSARGFYFGFDRVSETIQGYGVTANSAMVGYTIESNNFSFTPLVGINEIKHKSSEIIIMPLGWGKKLYVNTNNNIKSKEGMIGLAVSYSITNNLFIEGRATTTIKKHEINLHSKVSYANFDGSYKSNDVTTNLKNDYFVNASLSIGYKF